MFGQFTILFESVDPLSKSNFYFSIMGKIKKKIDNCYEVTGEWIVFLSSRNDREFLGENFCHEEITISKIEYINFVRTRYIMFARTKIDNI